MNILVIHPEYDMLKTLDQLLTDEGLNVIISNNRQDAIEQLQSMEFELIITDPLMYLEKMDVWGSYERKMVITGK